MSASILDLRPTGSAVRAGLASVYRRGVGHSTASCSCGWSGVRRTLKALAAQDAWTHCIQQGCDVSVPLVFGAG
ncbi:MAG: hypothetical protein HYZ39_14965 [Mycolicibacterium cosmeticum]|nr:hypothetical protein [Mycolicibacterium cosmeticum]